MKSEEAAMEETIILTKTKHVSLSAFSHRIEELVGGKCTISSGLRSNNFPSLILIDVTSVGLENSFEILKASDDFSSSPNCILYNVPDQALSIKLIEWPHVVGAFTPEDNNDFILEMLPLLLDEHIWIANSLANKLLKHIRRKPRQTHVPLRDTKLTKREKQILRHLKDGHTNQAIADLIFVSEHTIKSHLYSTYRKIGVRTRLEASNWVMDNLSLALQD